MKKAKDYIIFPLDVPSVEDAKLYIELLSDYVGMFKVGLELFIQAGPDIIKFINNAGTARVFLDLKLHDIPVTILRAMNRIAEMGVHFTTVHCGESVSMLEAAVKGSKGNVGVLGVTVLTSISKNDIKAAGFNDDLSADIKKLVLKRAKMAKDAGCTGVICSGLEVEMIKKHIGNDFVSVTPGIRPEWDNMEKDDQHRVTTPAMAIENGADYLVIGRPIRDAEDPKKAAIKIAKEINLALQNKKSE